MWPTVTDGVAWSVCMLVCLSVSQPCKNGWTNWDATWVENSGGLMEPCIRWGPDPPMARGNSEGERCHSVKYRDTRWSCVQKWVNWSRCHLGCGLGRAEGSISLMVFVRWCQCACCKVWRHIKKNSTDGRKLFTASVNWWCHLITAAVHEQRLEGNTAYSAVTVDRSWQVPVSYIM